MLQAIVRGVIARGFGPVPGAALALFALGAQAAEPPATRADVDSLGAVVRALVGEVARLREEGEDATGHAKVYAAAPGVSLGGYGEFLFEAPTGDGDAVRTADFYRFITYVGYKFSDRILMNTELEFEHATTEENASGAGGSVSVEFSYLEFKLVPGWSVRAGNLLIPTGFVNRMHEPPYYRGNARPTVERRILPTTWRELGVALVAEAAPGLRVEIQAVNGLDARGFGPQGLRGGRQSGSRARWEDVALAASLDWTGPGGITTGGSVFAGGADQGVPFDGSDIDAFVTVAEAHAETRRGPFRARVLVAATSIGDAAEIAAELGETVPERQRGGYLETSWDTGPWLGLPRDQALRVWARREDWDLQREVPAGLTPDPALDGRSLTVGVEYSPHPQVVLKLDWVSERNEADNDTADPVRLGAGFVF